MSAENTCLEIKYAIPMMSSAINALTGALLVPSRPFRRGTELHWSGGKQLLLGLFKGHFDTTSGGKREVQSYQRIASAIGVEPRQLLFLSDIVEELDAARSAGWHTVLLQRETAEVPAAVNGHRCVASFDAIDPLHPEHKRS